MRLALPGRKKPAAMRDPEAVAVPGISGADLAAIYGGERKGGDFYDFVRVAPHLVLFGLLDVAGKRDENQSIVSAAQNTFRELGTKLFSRDDINEAESMIELSLEINRSVMEAAHGPRSCPAFVGCYNETLGTICYSNAGHTPALLRHGSGITSFPATGLPFGLFSHVTHDAPTAAIEPGAALVLVSRGITEAKRGRQEYGLIGVEEGLRKCNFQTAQQLCENILDDVGQFAQKRRAENDVTALVLVRAASAMSAGVN
jgi:serine phosphatase RsbU (regulator of sigma subunit)